MSGSKVSAEDGAVLTPVLHLWRERAGSSPRVIHGVVGVPKEHHSNALQPGERALQPRRHPPRLT